MVKRVEKTLVASGVMNENYEPGTVRPRNKTMERLLHAFVVNRSYSEEEFYEYVAVSLVRKNWTAFMKMSLFFASVFVLLWIGIRLYVMYFLSISGVVALGMFAGMYLSPILGLLTGILAPGWKKYPLILLNLGLLIFLNYSLV
ncbi:hypothetical protein [Halobacillus salinus]|uniref:Uncharacterized protein n=1 Tax=Halobacillus salinus TaxID=192814 RepID=A0A4Z0H2B5_9BACI|nr:hypothetical protein [Halobacillus salinus]TGB03551.1 hypothetical protein E4663_00675 [Halobacillus salinus]